MSEPEKIRENQEKEKKEEPEIERNEKGQFIAGQSGNPAGKPEGAGIGFSITRLVKEELEKIPEEAKEAGQTYASLLIKKILIKAIQDGDTAMINKIWEYMDGKPKQPIEVEGLGLIDEQRASILELLKTVRNIKDDKTKA